ncbi:hypothetical protein TNCV_5095911 [Trichonephila clavipes]|nr:hypothetical protein TNCV_5095911 [Trichonephila clavipes]
MTQYSQPARSVKTKLATWIEEVCGMTSLSSCCQLHSFFKLHTCDIPRPGGTISSSTRPRLVRGNDKPLNTRGNIFDKSTQFLAFADDTDIIAQTPTAPRQAFLSIEKEALDMGLKSK